uniref:Uracil phosphoribosyltransferase (FUR1) homolog (S. cerevisiae) n=1 Tax=Hucho hucho TaxID=62062 RepID=A0A4W5PBJ5_9TELE
MRTYFDNGTGTKIKMPCQNQQLNNNDSQDCGNSVLPVSHRDAETIIRDKGNFLSCGGPHESQVVEEGLNQLPYRECTVTTPTGHKYDGLKFEKGNCGMLNSTQFPPDINRRKVLLIYPILSTGNTVIEAVRVLTEHGLRAKHILLSLFSTPHGTCKSIIQEFTEITILTTEVHPVAPTHFGQRYFGTD